MQFAICSLASCKFIKKCDDDDDDDDDDYDDYDDDYMIWFDMIWHDMIWHDMTWLAWIRNLMTWFDFRKEDLECVCWVICSLKPFPPNDMQLCIYSWAIMIWSLGYTGGILDVADVWLQH